MDIGRQLSEWYMQNILPRNQAFEQKRQMLSHPPQSPYQNFMPQPVGDYLSKVMSGGYLQEHAQNFRDISAGDYQKLGDYFGAGTIAGRAAKLADMDMLKVAQDAWMRDMPKEKIYDATGWWKDRDGKWKFELDDTGLDFKQDPTIKPGVVSEQPMGSISDVMTGGKTIENYPDVGDIRARSISGKGGSYIQDTGFGKEGIDYGNTSSGAHEVQHAIQQREGFARGGNPESLMKFDGTALLNSLESVPYAKLTMDEKISLSKLRKAQNASALTAFDQYRALPGEVEARNVQRRLPLTADDRRMLPPWLTEDM